MNISHFKGVYDKDKPTASTIDSFLDEVKHGKYRSETELVRSKKDKAERSKLKINTMPIVTISGVFSKRKEEFLLEHSGFISIDIDNQSSLNGIEDDEYTYACAKSVSGNGWFVIVKINPKKHKESFEWLASYYYTKYSIIVDYAPRNPASPRFYSYDPNLIINKKSKQSKTIKKKEVKLKSLPLTLGTDDFGKMINELVSTGSDLTDDYEDWRNIGFALASEFQESGREYYHTISSMSTKYNSVKVDKQYNECLKERKQGITIGTLYWMMQGCGVEFPKIEREPILYATNQLKLGTKKEDIKEGLKELYDKNDSQVETIIKTSESIDLTDLGDSQKEVLKTLISWLLMNYKLKLNEITRKVEVNDEILTESVLRGICIEAKLAFSNQYVNSKAIEEIIFSNKIPTYNPLIDFFEKHKDLETNGELQRMIDCIESKDDVQKEVYMRIWFSGMIASAIEGHAMRTVLALLGGQSTGKTYYFENLFPLELQPYSAESDLTNGKDDALLMTEKLLIYIDENRGPNGKSENAEQFKKLTSATKFDIRAPYARMNQTYKRLAVIGFSSNWLDILNDPTGNTRIMPVEVISIDHEAQNSIDRVALFVEIYRAWENGQSYKLDNDQLAHLSKISEDYQEVDPSKEFLEKYFRAPTEEEMRTSIVDSMSLSDMRALITNLTGERLKKRIFNLHAKKMFKDQEYSSARIGGKVRNCYKVVKLIGELKYA